MPAGSFVEDIAARNLFMPDATQFTTPAPAPFILPNGDACTRIFNNASAYYSDPTRFFALPWGVSNWTLEFWCNPGFTLPNTVSWSMRFSNDATNNYEWIVGFNQVLNNVSFSVFNAAGTGAATMNAGFSANLWNHFVIMLDCTTWVSGVSTSKTITTYRNGVLAATNVLTNASVKLTVTPNPRLYLLGSGGVSSTNMLIGKVAIYNRSLTPTEISDHYLAMTVA